MKKILLVVGLMVTSICLCACGSLVKEKKNDDLALPAHEYNIYLSTEITTVLNQLTTRMGTAKVLASNPTEDRVKDELSALDYSISVVQECLDVVDKLNIKGTYTTEKNESIRLIKQTLTILDNYKVSLTNKNSEDIRNSIQDMELVFASLTGLTNSTYK